MWQCKCVRKVHQGKLGARGLVDALAWLGLIGALVGFLASCSSSGVGPGLDSEEWTGTLMIRAADAPEESASGTAVDLLALENATISGTVDLFVEVNSRVGEIRFHLDGSATPFEIDDQAPFGVVLDTTDMVDGHHVLSARSPSGKSRATRLVAEAAFTVANDVSQPPETEPDPPDPVEPDPVEPAPVDPTPIEPDPWADPDGPLVIRAGGTYSGSWESLDPDVPAVTVLTSEPVVIENAYIRGAGKLISAPWSDAHLTVRNVQGRGIAPTRSGYYPGRFLAVEGFRYVAVENSSMVSTSGIYLNASASGATVRIVRNRALNIDGRKSDGQGGYSGVRLVQFVQLNAGRDLVDSEIAWNEVVNEPYVSRVEDVISLYKTNGTSSSPVRVHDNYIQGAFPADPRVDPFSGGGIMLGDGDGSFLHAFANHVVGTSNYGIAISGGHDNRIEGNRIVSCGQLSDGSPIASQNVGVYIYNYGSSTEFDDNVGFGNEFAWASKTGGRNDWWVPQASAWIDNIRLDAGQVVPCDAEAREHTAWLAKVVGHDIVVGPTTVGGYVTAQSGASRASN